MKALIFLGFGLALAAGDAAAACRVAAAPPPVASPAAAPFCVKDSGFCSPIAGGSLCGCTNEDGDTVDYLQAPDGTVSARPAVYGGMFGPEAFRAFEGDVDGDGRPDIVTARLQSISNGLGVSSWRLSVAPAGAGFPRPAAALDLAEFGPDIFAPRQDGGPGCRLLATRWTSGEDATWFTGVWYDVTAAGLSLDPAGGGVKLRLRNSFDRLWRETAARLEKATGLPGQGTPLAWLSGPKAVAFDPRLPGPGRDAQSATVAGIEDRTEPDSEGTALPTLVLRDAAGGETALPLRDILIGEVPARRLWPVGYHPADDAAWRGRAALIEPESPANDGGPVVWLR